MCRSIVTLRRPDPATTEEARAAALQFVRKVSGYRKPSKANEEVFERAVEEITDSVERLLAGLVVGSSGRSHVHANGERHTHEHDHAHATG